MEDSSTLQNRKFFHSLALAVFLFTLLSRYITREDVSNRRRMKGVRSVTELRRLETVVIIAVGLHT